MREQRETPVNASDLTDCSSGQHQRRSLLHVVAEELGRHAGDTPVPQEPQ